MRPIVAKLEAHTTTFNLSRAMIINYTTIATTNGRLSGSTEFYAYCRDKTLK